MIDRGKFFASVRKSLFGGKLAQGQVEGMNAILDAWEKSKLADLRWPAYMLATAIVETAKKMQPIKEYGGAAYFTRMYDINGERPKKARELGNLNPGDGAKFCGRGYVQLTGRTNYRNATKKLRDKGAIEADVDLESSPDLAMRADIAAAIMIHGMTEGWFTGKKLGNYFNAAGADWTNARRIINALDRAAEIGGYGKKFHAALTHTGDA